MNLYGRPNMSSKDLSKEQRVLIVMRKVLAQIVRETTPNPGMRHPLSEGTIEDIRRCFALISAREQELAKEEGIDIRERPVYRDQATGDRIVPISRIGRKGGSDTTDET